jgi:hypothetical protein
MVLLAEMPNAIAMRLTLHAGSERFSRGFRFYLFG